MVISDLAVDETLLRAELRSVSTTSGAQFVMTFGQMMMAMWSADSLDSLPTGTTYNVHTHICHFYELASH